MAVVPVQPKGTSSRSGRLVPTAAENGGINWAAASAGPGTVTVEEYNHALPGGYGTRTVPVGEFRYLHLADVAPSPLVGSDRPVVSVPDVRGGSWTARVDDSGTLLVAAPGRRARVVGRRGAFTAVVAPALSLDHRGRPWVAATTPDGRVLAGTTRRGRHVLRAVATSAPTASVSAIVLAGMGLAIVGVALVNAAPQLSERFAERRPAWSTSSRGR